MCMDSGTTIQVNTWIWKIARSVKSARFSFSNKTFILAIVVKDVLKLLFLSNVTV